MPKTSRPTRSASSISSSRLCMRSTGLSVRPVAGSDMAAAKPSIPVSSSPAYRYFAAAWNAFIHTSQQCTGSAEFFFMTTILMLLCTQCLQQCIYINRLDINKTAKEEYMATNSVAISSSADTRSISQGAVVVLGRFFFALIFLFAAPNHFTRQAIAFSASQGVPLASIAVPLSGVVAIAGGLSILLGYRAKLGAWLLVLFLIPVTLMLHKFWTVTDPMMAQIQMILFMKNVSMLGGALLISQFGAGPFSLDARRSR